MNPWPCNSIWTRLCADKKWTNVIPEVGAPAMSRKARNPRSMVSGLGGRPDALDAIERYDWPGNVRELRNVIERAVLLTPGPVVAAEALALSQFAAFSQPQPISPIGNLGDSGTSTLDDAERQLIAEALRQAKGNASKAARVLGVTRMALRYRIEKHGLRLVDFRDG